jgi:hypothetical protein
MKYIAIVLSTSFLAACGGGGGGGDTAPTVATPTAVLNNSNQNLAAQDTSSASFMPLLGAQTLTGAQTTDGSVLFNIAREQMDKLPIYMANAQANNTLTGVISSQSVACSNGGALTVSANDADNNGAASAGDTLTISSNGCVEAAGTLSGSIGFVINSASGTFGSTNYSAGMTMSFSDFSVTSPQFSAQVSGSLTFSVTANGVNTISATVSTPSLAVSGTYAGASRTLSLANYSATFVRAPSPTYTYTTSYALSGLLTSSSFSSQAISFATPTPMVTRYTDYYPSSGVLLITGASNSKVRLTALSNTQVSQELDANGDGTYESSTTVNWNTLM